MVQIKFDHSVKYNGNRYPAHVVFSADEKDIEELRAAGAQILFEMREEKSSEPKVEVLPKDEQLQSITEKVKETREKLLKMTVDQLKQFAEENEIDLGDKTKKIDIFNTIVVHLNKLYK